MSAEHAPVTPISPAAATPASLEELISQRATYKADAEYIQEQIDRIDAALLIRLGGPGTYDVAGVKVQVREYTRTDYERLAADFPVGEYPQLYSTAPVLDQAVVKEQFAHAALEQYVVHGKKSVIVR